jgi:hypothetical protein
MSTYISETERSYINNLILHLKLLGKQDQVKSTTTRDNKNSTKINEMEKKNYTKN